MATNALQALAEANETPAGMTQQEWDELQIGPREIRIGSDYGSDGSFEACGSYVPFLDV